MNMSLVMMNNKVEEDVEKKKVKLKTLEKSNKEKNN